MPKTKKKKAEAKVEIAEDAPEPKLIKELRAEQDKADVEDKPKAESEEKPKSKTTTRHPALDLVKKPTSLKDAVNHKTNLKPMAIGKNEEFKMPELKKEDKQREEK